MLFGENLKFITLLFAPYGRGLPFRLVLRKGYKGFLTLALGEHCLRLRLNLYQDMTFLIVLCNLNEKVRKVAAKRARDRMGIVDM